MSKRVTHLRRVDSYIATIWTGLFPIAGCRVGFHYFYALQKYLYLMQTE